jgi:hypothetical protein
METNKQLFSLSKYMLNKKNIANILNNIPTINKLEKKKKEIINTHSHRKDLFYYPDNSCSDSLFWCINIFRNGMDVIFNSNHKFTTEKTEKFAIVTLLREHKQILKNEKLKLKTIEGNLSSEPNISFQTLLALAIVFQFNLIYTTEKLFYEKIIDTSWKTCYIKEIKNSHGVWLREKDPEYYEIKGNKIVVDNIDRPLKPLSSYKKGDLQDMCKKLKIKFDIQGQKNFTKKKLYSLIQEHI